MSDTGPDGLHQRVVEGFRVLGASDPEAISQSILLRELRFVGRRFRSDGMQAVAMADQDTLQFYDGEGNLLRTVPVDGEPVKKAA
jgi:hypothetical protein